MAYLRSLDDQTLIPIEEGENLLVGRLPKCDVVIDDPSVSSQHARLQLLDSVLRVVDMNSTNGTRVNYTVLMSPKVLLDGDTVEFGSVSFIIDGPELQDERPSGKPSTLNSDWKRMEASQPIDATMSIELPEEMTAVPPMEETEAASKRVPRPKAAPASAAVSSPEAEASKERDPEGLVPLILLLGAAMILLLVEIARWPF